MTVAWLMIQGAGDGLARRVEAAAIWCPFEGGEAEKSAFSRDRTLCTWSLLPAHGRGARRARCGTGMLVLDGWVVEPPGAPLDRSVAENVADAIVQRSFAAVTDALDGQFSALLLDEAHVQASTGMLAGSHVYYGQRGGITVVSNRALLAASALHGGLPAPNLPELAWLLGGVGCPFGTATCWPDVHLLSGDQRLVLGETLRIDRRALPKADARRPSGADWQAEVDALVTRTAQIQRYPGVRFRMALTGGKDSRLVALAAHAGGALQAVEELYLKAIPAHPDAIVGAAVAERLGRNLVLHDPPQRGGDVFEDTTTHNFAAELALGAWDSKSSRERPDIAGVHGNYGEILKSHLRPKLLLGWPVARRFYTGDAWLDPFGLLTPPTRERHRAHFAAWVECCRADGTPLSDLHDRWHREARMGRWLGQTLQADATGPLSINPLPSRPLLGRYLALSPLDRKQHRLHFELMRRIAPDLWRDSFANDRWARRLLLGHPTPRSPVRGSTTTTAPQVLAWQRQADAMSATIEAETDDGFYDVVDRAGVQRLIATQRKRPRALALEKVFALFGLRLALRDGLTPRPVRITTPLKD